MRWRSAPTVPIATHARAEPTATFVRAASWASSWAEHTPNMPSATVALIMSRLLPGVVVRKGKGWRVWSQSRAATARKENDRCAPERSAGQNHNHSA